MPDRATLVAAILVALLAATVRALPAADYPLWQDEVASARIVVEPTLGDALRRVERTESTPPAWYLLAWLLHRLGAPAEAGRGISVAAGALLAGLVVVYGRGLLPLGAAATAGILVALGGQLISRGSELRAYALYALLALVFAWLLERAVERRSAGRLIALGLCTGVGLLTHYFFALAAVTGLVWLWTSPHLRAARARASAAVALGVLPFLAWTPFFWTQLENQRFSWIGDFDVLEAAASYSTFFWSAGPLYVSGQVQLGFWETVARLAVLAAVLAGSVVLARMSERGRLAALLATVPVALAAVLWLLGGEVFTSRNLLCAAPFAALAVAGLLAAVPRPLALAGAAAAVALVIGGFLRERDFEPPPYDRLADALEEQGWRPGHPVAIADGAHELPALGSSYGLRSPVGWYLPGHPELVLPPPSGLPSCVRAYAVAPDGRGATLLDDAEERRDVEGIAVARIPCAPNLEERAGEVGFLFVSRPAS
jgi:Dolichyl-phosphate-mannose-protein mannosyltransferase